MASLTKPASTRVVASALDRVAEDFLDLDKGKYGFRLIEDREMLCTYGRALMKKTSSFPVVEELANRHVLLSPEEMRQCDVDRDVKFEALFGLMREELDVHPLSPETSEDKEGQDEEEEEKREVATSGQVNADTGVEKTAEVQQPSSVVNEADLSGGNKSEVDVTTCLNKIKHLKILLDVKDAEIVRLDKRAEHLRNEFDAKYNALQIKSDANEARYLQLKEDYANAEVIEAEHTEYERVIHELGGKTISKVESEAIEAIRGVVRERKNRGPNSWEVAEHVSELRYLTNLFPLILSRHPAMKRWLDAYPQVQPARQNASRFRALSPTVPSRLIRDQLDMFLPVQNRRPPTPNRGDGNYTVPQTISLGRTASNRGRGGGRSGGRSAKKKEDNVAPFGREV